MKELRGGRCRFNCIRRGNWKEERGLVLEDVPPKTLKGGDSLLFTQLPCLECVKEENNKINNRSSRVRSSPLKNANGKKMGRT